MMTTLSHRRCPSLYLCDHPEAHQCISTRGGGSVPMVIQWPSVGSALLISSSRSSLAVTSHTGTSLEAHHWQKEVIRGLWLKQWESIKYSGWLCQNINLNHRKILLCAHWNSHDHLSHSVLYKKSFTVQTMDKCWPSCDIYEFQLSFSPSVPIFCMVICWQIFIVILGPERPEEMHLKIHTEKLVVQLWSYKFFPIIPDSIVHHLDCVYNFVLFHRLVLF